MTPSQPSRRARWQVPMRVLAAALLLNAVLSFNLWWPTPMVVPDFRVAPEFIWFWVLLLGWLAWRGTLSPRAWAGLTGAYALLMLGRYADVAAPNLFGRPLNLYWDGRELPRLVWVAMREQPIWLSAGLVLSAVALAVLLYRALHWAVGVMARDAAPFALRTHWVWGLTAAAAALAVANHAGMRATWPVVSRPVLPTYWHQAQLMHAALGIGRQALVLPHATAIETAWAAERGQALTALRSRDVYMLMLETVGAVVYDHPVAAATMAPVRRRFAADVAASGRHVATAFFTSPTFAGGSDLAQLGVLSGIDLSDTLRHDVLLTTQRPTLISVFKRHGYRTYGVYPALDWDWPERSFYGYDVFLDRRDLGYAGPKLGYWEVPDQFTMARFDQLHPRTSAQPPRFVFLPTISSHFPFSPTPPFQPDWARLLTSQPFDGPETTRAQQASPNWMAMLPDYLASVDYTYRWLGAWMKRPEPREAVYLLVGDHQPAANVTGEGASWDVPVHVVTRDAALLQRFVALGFSSGMEPARKSLGPLNALATTLLGAFSTASTSPVPAAPAAAPLQVSLPRSMATMAPPWTATE